MLVLHFKVTTLFSMTHSNATACLWRMHGLLLDFMHLLAMGMTETSELIHLEAVHILLVI